MLVNIFILCMYMYMNIHALHTWTCSIIYNILKITTVIKPNFCKSYFFNIIATSWQKLIFEFSKIYL